MKLEFNDNIRVHTHTQDPGERFLGRVAEQRQYRESRQPDRQARGAVKQVRKLNHFKEGARRVKGGGGGGGGDRKDRAVRMRLIIVPSLTNKRSPSNGTSSCGRRRLHRTRKDTFLSLSISRPQHNKIAPRYDEYLKNYSVPYIKYRFQLFT